MSLGRVAIVSDDDVVGPAKGRGVGGPSASRYFFGGGSVDSQFPLDRSERHPLAWTLRTIWKKYKGRASWPDPNVTKGPAMLTLLNAIVSILIPFATLFSNPT